MSVSFDIRMDNGVIRSIVRDQDTGPGRTVPAGAVSRDLWRRGQRVATGARRDCPVDTGRLRASITVDVRMGPDGPVIRVGSNVTYARWVNDGTRRMRARPFLTRNLDAAR